MIRNGITGQGLSVSSFYILWAVGWSVLAFFLGTMVFQRYEARAIKKL